MVADHDAARTRPEQVLSVGSTSEPCLPMLLRCGRSSAHGHLRAVRSPTVLQGDLASSSLPDVLRMLADGAATGCLHVVDPTGEAAQL